ncbi:regulator of G-protein signaling 7 [Caerostris extrusa]|uniref:Regulator of G-protein signaling 7 n=1 Tax=Caerostris extrusa TaxID=172846 RepID=A0AAV4MI05_CAEEX|nr:regulator of G-protein signaling 7 [Caerostris extrusa]
MVYTCSRVPVQADHAETKNAPGAGRLRGREPGRLQKMFSRKWEFIFMQAEASQASPSLTFIQTVICYKLLKLDQLDVEGFPSTYTHIPVKTGLVKISTNEWEVEVTVKERAFWDVHRPVPGCVNTTEMDIKKACRMNKPIKSAKSAVSGGRISPSVSEADLNTPQDSIKVEVCPSASATRFFTAMLAFTRSHSYV